MRPTQGKGKQWGSEQYQEGTVLGLERLKEVETYKSPGVEIAFQNLDRHKPALQELAGGMGGGGSFC